MLVTVSSATSQNKQIRIDADNDGDWDLAMTNPRLGRVEVFENEGAGRFRSVLLARGWDSNSCVVADMNNDGKMDIVVGTRDRGNVASISIFLNQTQAAGAYLKVRMKMPSPNPFAVGAVLTATATGTRRIEHIEKSRWNGTPVHLGLGAAQNCQLKVVFPGGRTVRKEFNSVNREITVDPSGNL